MMKKFLLRGVGNRPTDGVVKKILSARLKHDPEKCAAVFRKRSCSIKELKRDDDSTKSHRALARRLAIATARLALPVVAVIGVALPGEAQAQCGAANTNSFGGTQTTTCNLVTNSTLNPFTFTGTANIGGGVNTAVKGDANTPWNVTVANGATLTANGVGIQLLGSGSVTNAGSISGAGNAGVELGGGGSVTNQAGGMISSSGGVGVLVQSNQGTVTNAGSIMSVSGTGINLIAGGPS
jgi:hypothetical protein